MGRPERPSARAFIQSLKVGTGHQRSGWLAYGFVPSGCLAPAGWCLCWNWSSIHGNLFLWGLKNDSGRKKEFRRQVKTDCVGAGPKDKRHKKVFSWRPLQIKACWEIWGETNPGYIFLLLLLKNQSGPCGSVLPDWVHIIRRSFPVSVTSVSAVSSPCEERKADFFLQAKKALTEITSSYS